MYENVSVVTTGQMSSLLDEAPTPPPVALHLHMAEQRVQAVLLVWGRTAGGAWAAGVCYLHRTWHSRAVVTMWAPANTVTPHVGTDYRQVPRVALPDNPQQWPTLPPRYPGATHEWTTTHQHRPYHDPPR